MSKRDKLNDFTANLGDALDKYEASDMGPGTETPATAPGQMLAFRHHMGAYEERIAALEIALADAKKTEIPVALIDPNPWQPRTFFDSDEISKLADSIAETGLIHPVIVRRTPATGKSVPLLDTSRYQLVAGERRLRAHGVLGRESIKAIVVQASDAELAMMALAENASRADLTDYEFSKALRRAEGEFPTRTRLAEAVGIARSDLYKFFAFESLPDFAKASLDLNPGLLGRRAAEPLAALLKAQGDAAAVALAPLWSKLMAGALDQDKLAPALLAALSTKAVRSHRDIHRFYKGQSPAGQLSVSDSEVMVKLKRALLTEDQTLRLQCFVEDLLKEAEGKS